MNAQMRSDNVIVPPLLKVSNPTQDLVLGVVDAGAKALLCAKLRVPMPLRLGDAVRVVAVLTALEEGATKDHI